MSMLKPDQSHAHNHGENRDHALVLDNVALSRGGHALFSGVSLTILPGDVVWVGGENGIGKSSLLRLMTGLTLPDSGSISWANNKASCAAKDIIAYQGHIDAFKPTLSAREALAFWADIMDKNVDISALLSKVGLSARGHVPCGQLSAGQKRRLSLARLILCQKPIWIMDEPTAAMDAAGVELIHDLISAHSQAGGSAVIASHHAPHIASVRTRQLILKASPMKASPIKVST